MSQDALSLSLERARLFGALAVLAAGIVWSSGGLLVRATQNDTWSILIWRSLAAGAAIALVLAVQRRGRVWPAFRELGWLAPLGGLFVAVSMSSFVFALQRTTVFNTLMMLSMAPLMAAALGWLVLREPVRRTTWIAIAFAILGVAVMVWDGLRTDGLTGNLMALLAALGFAGFTVLSRASPRQVTTPCVVVGGLLGSAAAALLALSEGAALWIGWTDLWLCLAMGFAQIGFGFVLYTWGAQRLPAAEAALLAMTEVVFGPIWVWLVYAELPSEHAMVGGLILLGAVAYQAVSGLRRQRPPVGLV